MGQPRFDRGGAIGGNIVGEQFFTALSTPEVVGAEEHPLITALRTSHAAETLLTTRHNRFFKLHAAPILDPKDQTGHLVVTLRDVTAEIQQQQKLAAIQDAAASWPI